MFSIVNKFKIVILLCILTTVKLDSIQYKFGTDKSYDLNIIPIRKQFIFDYVINVSLETKQTIAQSFSIQSKLYAQRLSKNHIILYLTNFTSNLKYNGKFVETNKFPGGLDVLELPFEIVFKNDIQSKLILDENDKEWSINIKKSVVDLFKWHKSSLECSNLKHNISNTCTFTQEFSKSQFLQSVENRIYQYQFTEDGPILKSIVANEKFFDESDQMNYFYANVNSYQQLYLVTITAIENEMKIHNQMKINLDYTKFNKKTNSIHFIDVTGGREQWPFNPSIETEDRLDQLILYLRTTTNSKLDNNFVEDFIKLLERCNFDELETSYNAIKYKDLTKVNLFVNLLSYVGTHASTQLLKNIIVKRSLDEDFIIDLMTQMPNHLKYPDDELVKQLEDLHQFDSPDSKLGRVSVLSFATIAQKATEKLLSKYHKIFANKIFSKIENYQTKLLYLQALLNLHTKADDKINIENLLLPIIDGSIKMEFEFRKITLLSIESLCCSDKLQEILWSILSSQSEDTDIRIAAYNLLIKYELSFDKFVFLQNLLGNDPNEKLYTYHYNTMLSLAEEKCIRGSSFRTILKLARKPVANGIAGSIQHIKSDLFDNGLGIRVEIMTMQNGIRKTVKLKLISNVNEIQVELLSLLIIFNHESNFKFSNYIIVIKQSDRTIYTENGDDLNLERMLDISSFFTVNDIIGKYMGFTPDKLRLNNIQQKLKIVSLNSGLPLIWRENMPEIRHFETKIFGEDFNYDFQINFKYLLSKQVSLSIYNPFHQLYHTVQKINNVNVLLNIKLVMSDSPFKFVLFNRDNNTKLFTAKADVVTESLLESTNPYIKQDLLNNINFGNETDFNFENDIERNQNNQVLLDKNITLLGSVVKSKLIGCTKLTKMENINSPIKLLRSFLTTDLLNTFIKSITGNCGIDLQLQFMDDVDTIELSLDAAKNMRTGLIDMNKINASFVVKLLNKTELYNLKLNASASELQNNVNTIQLNAIINELNQNETQIDVITIGGVQDYNYNFNLTVSLPNKMMKYEIFVQNAESDEQKQIRQTEDMIYDECRIEKINSYINAYDLQKCADITFSYRKYQADLQIIKYLNENSSHMEIEKLIHLEIVFPVLKQNKRDFTEANLLIVEETNNQLYKQILPISLIKPLSLISVRTPDFLSHDYNVCVIGDNYLINTKNIKMQNEISKHWVPYITNHILIVSVKRVSTTAIKIKLPTFKAITQVLEVTLNSTGFNFLLNEKPLLVQNHFVIENYVDIHVSEHPNLVQLYYKDQIEVLFDGHNIRCDIPNTNLYYGKCFQ